MPRARQTTRSLEHASAAGQGRRAAALVALAVSTLLVAGCSLVGGAATPTPGGSESAGVPETPGMSGIPASEAPAGSAAPGASESPQGTDSEFDAFRAALEGGSPADPDALVAAIEAAGFPRGSIERTREVDSLGAPVTYLEIAVRFDGGCLIGQVGEGDPIALRADALGGGRCLVGDVIVLD